MGFVWFSAVAAKGVGEVGDDRETRACRGLACLTPVLVCIKIVCSPYIVAVVCLIHVLLSETDNNEEGIEKLCYKSSWKVNDNLSAFHKMLLLTVDWVCTVWSHSSLLLMFLSNRQLLAACISLHQHWRISQCLTNGGVIWVCMFILCVYLKLIHCTYMAEN
jgi:hypothetical protein